MADTTGYPELDSLLPRVAALAGLDQASLEREEIALVGRKAGEITAALKTLATRAPEERRAFGAAVNALKVRAETAIAARRAELDQARADAERRAIDLTMPSRRRWTGAVHPVSAVIDEICEIFRGPGLRHCPGAGSRDRLVQLPRAQLSGRSPGDGPARHAVPRRSPDGR